MKKGKVFSDKQERTQVKGLVLTAEEKKRLVDFLSILIEIDRRTNITGAYEKVTKKDDRHNSFNS